MAAARDRTQSAAVRRPDAAVRGGSSPVLPSAPSGMLVTQVLSSCGPVQPHAAPGPIPVPPGSTGPVSMVHSYSLPVTTQNEHEYQRALLERHSVTAPLPPTLCAPPSEPRLVGASMQTSHPCSGYSLATDGPYSESVSLDTTPVVGSSLPPEMRSHCWWEYGWPSSGSGTTLVLSRPATPASGMEHAGGAGHGHWAAGDEAPNSADTLAAVTAQLGWITKRPDGCARRHFSWAPPRRDSAAAPVRACRTPPPSTGRAGSDLDDLSDAPSSVESGRASALQECPPTPPAHQELQEHLELPAAGTDAWSTNRTYSPHAQTLARASRKGVLPRIVRGFPPPDAVKTITDVSLDPGAIGKCSVRTQEMFPPYIHPDHFA
ncbi:hypothetical protein MSPP1_003263 [Malassezia sp. CBS 17886]|nr:hypothetical protein MSPP1_003263 [Malassezia sp. CBS 17886]